MGLSDDVMKQFVKLIHNTNDVKPETTAYGTVTKNQNDLYVILDGSEVLTPVETTIELKEDDRVIVSIRDHHAIVVGNLTSPAIGADSEGVTNVINNEVFKLEQYIDREIESVTNELTSLNDTTKTTLENNINQVNDELKTSIRNTHTELEDRIDGFSDKLESEYIINTLPNSDTLEIEAYNDDAIDIIKNTPVIKYQLEESDIKRVGISLEDAPSDIIHENTGVDLLCMISLMWAALQQQQAIIDELLNNTEEEGSE